MNNFLNTEQINYVLFHAGHHYTLNERIIDSMSFLKPGEDTSSMSNRIIFHLSDKQIEISAVRYIGELPVLFPVNNEKEFFKIVNGNVIFSHDILKSAFYLLSGQQETIVSKPDFLGRFPYESSIQSQLKIISKPVVNYYFEEIYRGISEYCKIHGIEFERKKPFSSFAFSLTHDIDRITYYNFNTFLYTFMQLAGMKEAGHDRAWLLRKLLRTGVRMFTTHRNDPYWNFEPMSGTEQTNGIRSTWFFLAKDEKHTDSYYKITGKKIRGLISFLESEGHEIGLHGTVRSHYSAEALAGILDEINAVTGKKISGIRQHRLMWRHPDTALIQESAGLIYDTTLGFAGHEGFRNSYCHPFRLFDFSNNRMMSNWEIPLNVMDSTLFDYRLLSPEEAMSTIDELVREIKKFGGVFTLLWHNSYLNDFEKPGISGFYTNLLKKIMSERPEVLTGAGIIGKMNKY